MKVLHGSLVETRYSSPSSSRSLEVLKETKYKENEVTYMSDELGLHKISNPGETVAVSLHRESFQSVSSSLLEGRNA